MKDLNLVPKSYFQKRKKRKKIVFYSFFSAVVAVAIAVIVLMPVLKIQSMKSRAAFLSLKAKESSGYIETENQFNLFKSIYQQRENEAKRLSGLGIDTLKIVEKLESYMPDKIFIQNITVSGGKNGQSEITIRGIASSEKEIAAFYQYISKDRYFNNINIGSVVSMQTSDDGKDNGGSGSGNTGSKESDSSYSFDAVILTAGK